MLAAVLLLAQKPQTITFTHPCAHSSLVLEALGREMGVAVRPSGTVNQDFFAIKLTDIPIEEAKRVISETLNAEWVQKESVLYLDRGPKQRLQEKKAEDEAMRKAIQAYLEKNKESAFDKAAVRKGLLDFSEAQKFPHLQGQAYEALRPHLPQERLGANVVRALGEEFFVRVEEGVPVKFFHLAAGESNMPAGVKNALAGFLNETESFQIITGSLGTPGQFSSVSASRQSDFAINVTRMRGFVQVTLLRLSSNAGANLNVETSQLASFNGRITQGSGGRRPSLPLLKGQLNLSATARSLARVISRDPEVTSEDRTIATATARDLVSNELHTLLGAAPLLEMAVQTGRDFVALIPDTVVTECSWARNAGTVDLNAVWNNWQRGIVLTEDEKTKVVMLRPTDPVSVRSSRYERMPISRLITDYSRVRRVTLDALASFAYQFDTATQFMSNWRFAARLAPLGQEQREFVALKTYGSLNPVQKRYAQNGGCVLPLRSLAAGVRSLLEEQLVSQGTTFASQAAQYTLWNGEGKSYSGNTSYGALAITGQIPQNCEVKIVVLKNTLLRPSPSPRNTGAGTLLTAEQIAGYRNQPPNEWNPDYTKAAVVNVDRLQVEVFAPGIGYAHFVAQVDDTGPDTKFVPLNELPEPWRTQIASAMRRGGG